MQAYRRLGHSVVTAVYMKHEENTALPDDRVEGPCASREASSDDFIEGQPSEQSTEKSSAALSGKAATAGVGHADIVLDWLRDSTSGFESLEKAVGR